MIFPTIGIISAVIIGFIIMIIVAIVGVEDQNMWFQIGWALVAIWFGISIALRQSNVETQSVWSMLAGGKSKRPGVGVSEVSVGGIPQSSLGYW